MSKENQSKKNDGQNRCRRCDKPLSDPNDIYVWRYAEIVGLGVHQGMTAQLDGGAGAGIMLIEASAAFIYIVILSVIGLIIKSFISKCRNK